MSDFLIVTNPVLNIVALIKKMNILSWKIVDGGWYEGGHQIQVWHVI